MSRRSLYFKQNQKWIKTYNPRTIPIGASVKIRKDGHEAPYDVTKSFDDLYYWVQIDGMVEVEMNEEYCDTIWFFGRDCE